MVIDIDGTIAEHFLRTQQIFLSAIKEIEFPDSFLENLHAFDPYTYDYNPKPNLIEMGLEGELLKKMLKYWDKYFFSNRFLHLDEQIEGASEFVHKILGLDIDVIYLTGRDDQMVVEGKVVWTRSFTEGKTKLFDNGLEFININQEQLDIIDEYRLGSVYET